MNLSIADIRASSLAWLAACAALLVLALLLFNGTGRDPQWLPPLAPPPAHTDNVAASGVPDIAEQRLALIWQQPLFSPDRHADPMGSKAADAGLAGVTLTGVVFDGPSRWALLREGQRSLKLKVGASLDNGWQLQQLAPRQATFVYQGQSRQLTIPTLRLPPPSSGTGIKLPIPSVVRTDAPQEAEPPVTAP